MEELKHLKSDLATALEFYNQAQIAYDTYVAELQKEIDND